MKCCSSALPWSVSLFNNLLNVHVGRTSSLVNSFPNLALITIPSITKCGINFWIMDPSPTSNSNRSRSKVWHAPPARSCCSSTSTLRLDAARILAVVRPERPLPITITSHFDATLLGWKSEAVLHQIWSSFASFDKINIPMQTIISNTHFWSFIRFAHLLYSN